MRDLLFSPGIDEARWNRARALVAFPGGYGIINQAFENLRIVHIREDSPLLAFLAGRELWLRDLYIPYRLGEGIIDSRRRSPVLRH